jgi:hypothetical protein
MLYKSQIITQGSGSVNGLVYSHNRGGNYTRMRKTPVNPATTRQEVVRGLMGLNSNAWVNSLTAAERTTWDTYAFNVPLTGPLGDPRNVGGLGMYQRSNIPRSQAGLSAVTLAPTIWDTGNPPFVFVPTYDASAGTVSVAFGITEQWYTAPGSLLFYMSRPQNATINFYKGPWRFVGAITPPDLSPQVFGPPLPYTVQAGQVVFTRYRATYDDGRLTQAQVNRSVVVA